MIDYDKFQKSLSLLASQFDHYQTLDKNLATWMQEAVKESVIQRFETCYDCLWKILKRYLFEELGIPDVPNSPKPIFRLSNENNLLPSNIEQWLNFANVRAGTSHDYSGKKAEECLAVMESFIRDAIGLYETMSKKQWE